MQRTEKVIREKVCVCVCYTLGSLPDTAGRRLRAASWVIIVRQQGESSSDRAGDCSKAMSLRVFPF